MKFSTIYEHSGKIITALIVILILAAIGCGNLYLNNQLLISKLVLKSQAARKDSIEAVRKDIAFKNVVHPESVVVDKEKGMVYFAVRNDKLSDNPLPVIESTIPDTISLSASTKTIYKEVTDTSKGVISLLADLRARLDSMVSVNSVLQQSVLIAKEASRAKSKADTVKIKSPSFDAPYSLFSKGNQQQLPRLQISAAFQLSHSWLNRTTSFGIGGNIYWKHLRFYNGINYNLELKKVGGTSSVGYDIFNIYKSKK